MKKDYQSISNVSSRDLWYFSKKIQEEIYFQTQLRTGTSSTIETIEKYQKNLKSQRRIATLSGLAIVYVIGAVSIIPLLSVLQLLFIEKSPSNIHQVLFTGSLVFGVYNLYIFFLLFMGGLMLYVTFMNGKYFQMLQPLPLNSRDLTQLSFYVFIRMNSIQMLFIIFALPVATFLLTLNPLVFLIIFLNNLTNTLFIIFLLIIIAWIYSQRVYTRSKQSRIGPLITILTMILYAFTVLPIFLLMSKLLDIVFVLFEFGIGMSIPLELNQFLSLIPFPMSSGYLTCQLLLLPTNLVPVPLMVTTIISFSVYILLIFFVIRKGTTLIGKLNQEVGLQGRGVQNDPIKISIKISPPLVKMMKTNLVLVFRDYSALTLFTLAMIFPVLITTLAFIWPDRYITWGGGLYGFMKTMLFFLSGTIMLLFFQGAKVSERNLGDLLSQLPIEERKYFRSKQMIIIFGSLIPLFVAFGIISILGFILPIEPIIQIIVSYILAGTELLILYAFLFGKFNNRYTLTVENDQFALLKLGIIFLCIFITMIGYLEIIDFLSKTFRSGTEIFFTIIVGGTFYFGLEIFSRIIFRSEKIRSFN